MTSLFPRLRDENAVSRDPRPWSRQPLVLISVLGSDNCPRTDYALSRPPCNFPSAAWLIADTFALDLVPCRCANARTCNRVRRAKTERDLAFSRSVVVTRELT